ncbi:hypothetical protein J6590_057910 [Homalodisca vitripennis]|nr:hypothetical protein J6590_057910 [Homalodisca vitripennis]
MFSTGTLSRHYILLVQLFCYQYHIMMLHCHLSTAMTSLPVHKCCACKGSLVPHQNSKAIQCCNFTDLCNKELRPMYSPRPTESSSLDPSLTEAIPYIALIISVTVCFIAFLVIITCVYLRYKKKEESRQMYLMQGSRDMYLSSSHTLKHLIDQSSGSGSGLPLLSLFRVSEKDRRSRKRAPPKLGANKKKTITCH